MRARKSAVNLYLVPDEQMQGPRLHKDTGVGIPPKLLPFVFDMSFIGGALGRTACG